MNREYAHMNEEEREIDLADLFFCLLSKWRILIIAVMIGIFVGFGIYLMKSGHEESVSENVMSEEYEAAPEVLSCMQQALSYRIMYFQQSIYQQESYIMQMNPQAVYTGVLEYYLSAGDNTALISERCQNIINDRDLITELQKVLGVQKNPQYLQELLGCSITVNNTTRMAENNTPYSIATFTVAFTDENVCNAMLQAMQEKVENELKEYQEQYGEYDYEVINDFIEIRRNEDYGLIQKNSIDGMTSYVSGYTNLESGLSGEDKTYYDTVYLPNGLKEAVINGLPETVELQTFLETQEIQVSEEVQSQHSIKTMAKWILLGIVLMIAIWSGYYILKYLFDRHVKSARELQNVYGLCLLGNVVLPGEKRNVVDQWIDRAAKSSQIPTDTPDYVKHMIALMGGKNVIVCGAVHDTEIRQLFPGMVFEDFVHQSQVALQKAKESDGIILLVKKGRTYYHEIRRELEICDLQGIIIMGTIVVA